MDKVDMLDGKLHKRVVDRAEAISQPQILRDLYRENTRDLEQKRAYAQGAKHYESMGVEPWQVIDSWPIEQQVGYHRGNILKYTMRLGTKDERLKEARKIADYAQKLVEVLERS